MKEERRKKRSHQKGKLCLTNTLINTNQRNNVNPYYDQYKSVYISPKTLITTRSSIKLALEHSPSRVSNAQLASN